MLAFTRKCLRTAQAAERELPTHRQIKGTAPRIQTNQGFTAGLDEEPLPFKAVRISAVCTKEDNQRPL